MSFIIRKIFCFDKVEFPTLLSLDKVTMEHAFWLSQLFGQKANSNLFYGLISPRIVVLKCIIFVLLTIEIPFFAVYQVLKKCAIYVSRQFTPRFRTNFCENSVKSKKYNTVIHLPENNSQKKVPAALLFPVFWG